MSLERFLDLVWVEIWDDCSAMSDRGQYRRVMKQLFLDGTPPHDIWYESYDEKGKKVRKRLSDTPSDAGGSVPRSALEEGRAMRERAIEAARKAREKAENKEIE